MKKIFYLLPILGIFLHFGTSCNSQNAVASPSSSNSIKVENAETQGIFKDVDAPNFHQLIQQGEGVLIDVRTPREFAQGHIEGADLHDFYDRNNFWNTVASWDKNKTYLLYCRSGNRSGQTMHKMKGMGFKEVYNLAGGVGAWARAGHNFVK